MDYLNYGFYNISLHKFLNLYKSLCLILKQKQTNRNKTTELYINLYIDN